MSSTPAAFSCYPFLLAIHEWMASPLVDDLFDLGVYSVISSPYLLITFCLVLLHAFATCRKKITTWCLKRKSTDWLLTAGGERHYVAFVARNLGRERIYAMTSIELRELSQRLESEQLWCQDLIESALVEHAELTDRKMQVTSTKMSLAIAQDEFYAKMEQANADKAEDDTEDYVVLAHKMLPRLKDFVVKDLGLLRLLFVQQYHATLGKDERPRAQTEKTLWAVANSATYTGHFRK